jgi:RNA polymerase sigma factor (sigma-70 family)
LTCPTYLLPEHLESFIAEHVSVYQTTAGASPRNMPECHPLTNEELSNIRRELRKLTSLRVLNANDAEDLVQDTLLTLIHSCPEEGLEKGHLAWSAGILRNKIGNYYRKGRYRINCEASEANLREGLSQTISMVSPEGELLRGELGNVIANAVDRLPKAQKKAIKMLMAGLSPGEIAEKMSPERYQAVINHLHRGRKKLAQELARYGLGGMHEMRRAQGLKKPTREKNKVIESAS